MDHKLQGLVRGEFAFGVFTPKCGERTVKRLTLGGPPQLTSRRSQAECARLDDIPGYALEGLLLSNDVVEV